MPGVIVHSRASMKISNEMIRWFRIRRSGLVTPFASPVQAAQALVGVQAQILPAAGLSIFNRCSGMSEATLDDLLYHSRSLVRIWGQRGTLHLFAIDDWALMIGALSDHRSYWEEESVASGLSRTHYGRVLAEVEKLLEDSDSMGRRGLVDSGLPLHGSSYSPWGGIYADLVRKGVACHVKRVGGEGHFAHRHKWLPDLEWCPLPYEDANKELIRRYARTYGPLNDKDVAYWRGAGVTDVRRWLQDLNDEMETVESEQGELRCRRRDLIELMEGPPARGHWPLVMLYRFDPLLLGYRNREWILEEAFRGHVSRTAGHIEGVVLSPKDGMICATWRYARSAGGLKLDVSPFRPLSPALKRAIKLRGSEIAGYFSLPLKTTTFARPVTS